MDVRAALQNMVAMLVCVKKGSKAIKRPAKDTDKKMTKEKEIEDKDDVDEQEEETTKSHAPIIERVETEGCHANNYLNKTEINYLISLSLSSLLLSSQV